MSDLKITKIEAFPYALPTRRKFRWASLKDQIGGFVFVKIETNSGII
ncbi:MAG: muconate cycloisomerase, partial [Deltaproteobacteria bacterium]